MHHASESGFSVNLVFVPKHVDVGVEQKRVESNNTNRHGTAQLEVNSEIDYATTPSRSSCHLHLPSHPP